MSIIICWGPTRTDDGHYRCGCCGYESANLDAFLGSLCYLCGFGANPHCERCVDSYGGVPFNRFRKGRKLHRLAVATPRGEPWRARCGYTLPSEQVGNATAVIFRYCQHCYPLGSEEEA